MRTLFKAAALFIALLFPGSAFAATCFWVPYAVSGAISGTGGVCRLTISAITGSGLLAGDTIAVAGIAGATGCNLSTTISTVVDSTHIELAATTFGGAYTSGGTVGGGHMNTTNTTNWASATGGTVGTCAGTGGVPKNSNDIITLDANSGGSTIVADPSIASFSASINGVVMGNFTGTFDFSVNNPNFTLGQFSAGGGTGSTLNMGSGTWQLTAAFSTPWNINTTNFTLFAASSTLNLGTTVSASNTRSYVLGNGFTYGTINIGDGGTTSGGVIQNIIGNSTVTTLNLIGPLALIFSQSQTLTVTNAVNWNSGGSATKILNLSASANVGAFPKVTLTASGGACNWCVIGNTIVQTNSLTANNSFDAKGNTLVTFSGFSGGSAGGFGPVIQGN